MDSDGQELLTNQGGPPGVASKQTLTKLNTPTTVPENIDITPATFTKAKVDDRNRKLPQCIAHRGFRAKFPENTILAFKEAIKAGATGLETDVHLTKDDVVVISHDPSLKRCYGLEGKIIDYTWDELKDLRTVAEPHMPLPRLKDVLEFLREPENKGVWLLLDIKFTNDEDDIMRLIASTVASVEPPLDTPWTERVVLGIWAAKYLPLALKYSPGYPIVNIALGTAYARHFFTIPNIGISLVTAAALGPGGENFVRACQQENNRELLAWTVNSKDRMEWCIRHGLDGLITDDPIMYQQVCDEYDEKSAVPNHPISLWTSFSIAIFWIVFNVLFLIFGWRFRPVASPALVAKKAR